MSAQTNYEFKTWVSVPGGKIDISPDAIDAYQNEEEHGVMLFGVAVVAGSVPGRTVKLPTAESKGSDILGITLCNRTTEHGWFTPSLVRKEVAVNVMEYGHIWARVPEDAEIAFNDDVYVVTDGDYAGYLVNADYNATKVQIAAKFTSAPNKSLNNNTYTDGNGETQEEAIYVAAVRVYDQINVDKD